MLSQIAQNIENKFMCFSFLCYFHFHSKILRTAEKMPKVFPETQQFYLKSKRGDICKKQSFSHRSFFFVEVEKWSVQFLVFALIPTRSFVQFCMTNIVCSCC